MRGGTATRESRTSVEAQLESITAELLPIEAHLWGLAIATAALDVYLTTVGLEAGLTEGNPLVASLIETVGITALVGLKASVFGLAALARWRRPAWGPWLSLGLAVPWFVAAGINAVLLMTV